MGPSRSSTCGRPKPRVPSTARRRSTRWCTIHLVLKSFPVIRMESYEFGIWARPSASMNWLPRRTPLLPRTSTSTPTSTLLRPPLLLPMEPRNRPRNLSDKGHPSNPWTYQKMDVPSSPPTTMPTSSSGIRPIPPTLFPSRNSKLTPREPTSSKPKYHRIVDNS